MTSFSKTKGSVLIRGWINNWTLNSVAAGAIDWNPQHPSYEQKLRVLKMSLWVNPASFDTADAITFGLTDGDLDATEVNNALNSDGPVSDSDYTDKGESKFPIFMFPQVHGSDRGEKYVSRSIRWTFSAEHGPKLFVYNYANNTTAAAASVDVYYEMYGMWVD